MLFKILWVIRGLLYKPFFGKFGFLSYIGQPIYIANFKRIFIGNRVRIFPRARIEVVNKNSSIIFEDNISIGQNFHIISSSTIKISKNTTISANVLVTDTDHNYQEINVPILEQHHIVKETKIGENCFIGYGAVIQAGTILGKQCVVGANSVVKGEFPAYSVLVGAPARIVKRYDEALKCWRRTNVKGDFIDE